MWARPRSATGVLAAAALLMCAVPASADLDVHTIAGGGIQIGDGGPATSASVDPSAVLVGMPSNARLVAIADAGHCRVRTVDPAGSGTSDTGNIATLAGHGGCTAQSVTSATAASTVDIGAPQTLSAYPQGPDVLHPNFPIIIGSAMYVYRYDSYGQTLTTIAGNGTCSSFVPASSGVYDAATFGFCTVRAVAAIGTDDFLIASDCCTSSTSHEIYRVQGNPGKLYLEAGQACGNPAASVRFGACFESVRGIALGQNGDYYVADVGTKKVWHLNVNSDGVGGVIADSSQLTAPTGIGVASDGSVYVGDGCTIKKITNPNTTPSVSTIAGGSCDFETFDGDPVAALQAHIIEPEGLSMGSAGLFVADRMQDRVRLLDRTTISSGPPRLSNQTTAAFTFDKLVAGDALACTFDAQAVTCPDQANPLDPVPPGIHGITATAGADPTPATRDWSVDTTPPAAPALVEPADGATGLPPAATFKWSPVNLKDPQELPYDGRYELWIDGAKQAELGGPACPSSPCSLTSPKLGTGEHHWFVKAVDSAGNATSSATRGFSTGGPPTAVLSLAPNPVLAGREVTADGSGSADPDEAPIARYEFDFDGDGAYEVDAGAASTAKHTFTSVGAYTIGLRVTDRDGQAATATQTLQVNAPVTPTGLFGVTIDNGAQYTRTPDVTVTASFPPSTTQMLFSNDGGFLAPTVFTPQKTVKWKLDSSGPERLPKTIYVRFSSNGLLTETYQDDIILDETPPKVQQAAVKPAAGVASVARLRSFTVKVKATDSNSGVDKVQVTANKRKPGKLLAYRTKLEVKASSRKLYVRARDRAGNFSRWKKAK